MKIAIDIRNIGKKRTGSEVVVFELVKHLAQIDRDNIYYLLTDYRTDDEIAVVERRLQIENVENFSIKQIGSGGKLSWTLWSVPTFCKKNKIDIYHTEYIIPFFMPKHTKVITHIHDVSFRVHKELITKKDAFFLNTLIPRAVDKSDKIIAVSQFTKDEIVKYYNVAPEKIEVVYNAVSVIDSGISREALCDKYQLPNKYILALGTMQPRKNIPFLINSFAKLTEEVRDIKLVLVGKKSHNFDNEIQRSIENNPHIKDKIVFTGYIDEEDKFGVYGNAELFVFPSLYEGFGVPILEAFSANTLTAASNIPPHREVGGDGALYFDPLDVDQCAQTLYDALVNDNIKRIILTAASEQKDKFSWKKSAEKLRKIYKSI